MHISNYSSLTLRIEDNPKRFTSSVSLIHYLSAAWPITDFLQAYDKCIEAIQDDRAAPQLSTWDC